MIIGFILLALALAQFVIGLRFIIKYQRGQSTIWYGLMMIGVAFYVGANGFSYLSWLNGSEAERLAWLGAVVITTCFLAFSYSYPVAKKKVSELLTLILWPCLVFIPAFLWTDLIVKDNGLINYRDYYARIFGDYFWFFLIFFVIYWIWSFINIVHSRQLSDGIHRKFLTLIFTGTTISVVVATVFDILIPLAYPQTRFGYVGPLCTAVWFGYTGYILLKK